jgi:hypothetical protein
MAVAKRTARLNGVRIGNFLCASASNPATLYALRPASLTTFVITSTTRLPLNSLCNKLSITSIVRAARHLAKMELEIDLISERMGISACDTKIQTICKAIDSRRGALDSVWCAFILISYLTSHHTGRSILRTHTNLTDLDYQTVSVFENYGRSEITRRARLEASQRAPSKRQKLVSKRRKVASAISSIAPIAPIAPIAASEDMDVLTCIKRDVELGLGAASDAAHKGCGGLPVATAEENEEEVEENEENEEEVGEVGENEEEYDETGLDFATETTMDLESAFVEAEDSKELLAVKRKRSARNYAASSAVDSACLLTWWLAALQHGQASVLFSLVSQSKATAKAAAQLTLQAQAQGCADVAENQRIIEISEQNAIESASALVPLVGRLHTDTPAVLIWQHRSREMRSLMRTVDEHKTTMAMAMKTPHHALEPRADTKLWISWMNASLAFMPYTDNTTHLPGVMEKLAASNACGAGGKRSSVIASRLRASALMDAEQPRTPGTSGLTRSVLSMEMTVRVHPSVIESGKRLGRQLSATTTTVAAESASATHVDEQATDLCLDKSVVPSLIACVHDTTESRFEPMCLPSSPLAIGLQMSEQLREWYSGKSRRNNPVKASLSVISASELGREVPLVINAEPPPALHITDVEAEMCQVEADDEAEGATEQETETVVIKMGVALHVCGDSAVRVPEAVGIFRKLYANQPLLLAQRIRSLLLGAINQANWMADVGPAITAGWSNSAIQSSKKVSVADSHRLLFLSPFDTYVVGLSALEKAHPGSPYASTYGSCLDTGLTPPGLLGSNYRADRRQHGSLTLSQETADECSEHFAHCHFCKVDETAYVEIPPACRGIPHSLPVSLYKGLDGLEAALDDVRRGVGRAEDNFVPALQVLPFSPWSQGLSPFIDLASDPTIRLGVRDATSNSFNNGVAYLPDSTSFKDAIAREPLIRRPSQLSSQDNPFLTPHGSIESFFCCASAIAIYSRQLGGLDATRDVITRVVANESVPAHQMVLALDVLMLINLMYPTTWGTPEAILLPAIEHSIPSLQAFVVTASAPRPDLHAPTLQTLLNSAAETFTFDAATVLLQMQTYWQAFLRSDPNLCAWQRGLRPLVAVLDENDGSHAVPTTRRDTVRACLEEAIRCAFLVHSADGLTPPANTPMADCKGPQDVRRGILDPIWVSTRKHAARSTLVGVKPHALRQATLLAMAAELPGIRVQVIRNEGGLSLRVSSAADVLDQHGETRSEKSISPLQVEGASTTFGSRAAKVVGCKQQRIAWDQNTKLLMPVITAINPPRSLERRDRGSVYSINEALLRATRCVFHKTFDFETL